MSDDRLEHYKEGMSLFGQNRFGEAVAAYQRALDASPDWTEALHGKAMAQMQGGQVDEAIETGKRIVEVDSNDAFAHTSLSIFYMKKSQLIEEGAQVRRDAGASGEELAGMQTEAKDMIQAAEDEGAKARMISWKEELKTNPHAAPPGPAGSMDVIQ
jgi:tetratricopeptide (TPR) repeat protein